MGGRGRHPKKSKENYTTLQQLAKTKKSYEHRTYVPLVLQGFRITHPSVPFDERWVMYSYWYKPNSKIIGWVWISQSKEWISTAATMTTPAPHVSPWPTMQHIPEDCVQSSCGWGDEAQVLQASLSTGLLRRPYFHNPQPQCDHVNLVSPPLVHEEWLNSEA